MSKRPWKTLLEDILEAIDKIQRYTENIDFDDFVNTPMMVDAVIRNIEIIGEAANYIPSDIQDRYPQIPWQKIKGTRNRIIHEYFGVDVRIIWFIVENELELLKHQIMQINNN